MATLTRKQRESLETVLYHAKRAERYLKQPSIAIAKKGGMATTTLHCVNQQGTVLYELDKEIGSDLCGLYDAVRSLDRFLNPPTVEIEEAEV
jgi:hypothetical protein